MVKGPEPATPFGKQRTLGFFSSGSDPARSLAPNPFHPIRFDSMLNQSYTYLPSLAGLSARTPIHITHPPNASSGRAEVLRSLFGTVIITVIVVKAADAMRRKDGLEVEEKRSRRHGGADAYFMQYWKYLSFDEAFANIF